MRIYKLSLCFSERTHDTEVKVTYYKERPTRGQLMLDGMDSDACDVVLQYGSVQHSAPGYVWKLGIVEVK